MLAALAAAAIGMWIQYRGALPSTAAEPSTIELQRLQGLADKACLCTRRSGQANCWADFERQIDRYEHSEGETACMEASVATVCFGPDDGRGWADHCVFRRRGFAACTAQEEKDRAAKAKGTCAS